MIKCPFLHQITHIRGVKTAFFHCFRQHKKEAFQSRLECLFYQNWAIERAQNTPKFMLFKGYFFVIFTPKSRFWIPKKKVEGDVLFSVLQPQKAKTELEKWRKPFASNILRQNRVFGQNNTKERGFSSFFIFIPSGSLYLVKARLCTMTIFQSSYLK